jgi:hypothetical protein
LVPLFLSVNNGEAISSAVIAGTASKPAVTLAACRCSYAVMRAVPSLLFDNDKYGAGTWKNGINLHLRSNITAREKQRIGTAGNSLQPRR